MSNLIPDSPGRQIFQQQWNNYIVKQLFGGNEEVAWELFKDVWNLAIEEAYNVVQIQSVDSAKLIQKLTEK